MTQAMSQIDAVKMMEYLVGKQDWQAATAYFTPDVMYKVGAREPVYGVAGIRGYLEWQNQHVVWQGHTLRLQWNYDDIVVIEVDSHFMRVRDQHPITVPCTDIYRMNGLQIREWRVYADMASFLGDR
jgi:limonene-1,2-epoxide hydrolase